MGYLTCFSGEIQFSNKKSYDFAKLCFDNDNEDDFTLWDSDFNDSDFSIHICEDWKDYHDQMVSICLMALDLDKDVLIDINCSGEESDDIWEIGLEDNKIVINRGRIVYDDVESVSDKLLRTEKYLKRLYDITKDEKLLKEIMMNKLEKAE